MVTARTLPAHARTTIHAPQERTARPRPLSARKWQNGHIARTCLNYSVMLSLRAGYRCLNKCTEIPQLFHKARTGKYQQTHKLVLRLPMVVYRPSSANPEQPAARVVLGPTGLPKPHPTTALPSRRAETGRTGGGLVGAACAPSRRREACLGAGGRTVRALAFTSIPSASDPAARGLQARVASMTAEPGAQDAP